MFLSCLVTDRHGFGHTILHEPIHSSTCLINALTIGEWHNESVQCVLCAFLRFRLLFKTWFNVLHPHLWLRILWLHSLHLILVPTTCYNLCIYASFCSIHWNLKITKTYSPPYSSESERWDSKLLLLEADKSKGCQEQLPRKLGKSSTVRRFIFLFLIVVWEGWCPKNISGHFELYLIRLLDGIHRFI